MSPFCRQTSTGKLCFLTAHDIGRIGQTLGEARHDADEAVRAGLIEAARENGMIARIGA